MEFIFYIIVGFLYLIAGITGLTYNEINIILYFMLIPFSWLAMLDKLFNFHWLKIGFAALCIVFFVFCPNFTMFSDALFAKSVIFLKWFNHYGMDYITASVVFCVLVPLLVYAALGMMLYLSYRIRKRQRIVKDREMLEKRLKELAETEYTGELSYGAMCYSMAAPTKEYYTCPVCWKKTVQTDYIVWDIKTIRKIVAEIKQLGYDVILDEHEFCVKCGGEASKIVKEEGFFEDIQAPDAQLIFKIRLSPNETYHTAQSDIISDYNCVLEFLKGNDFCRGEMDETLSIHDNIDVIQKMLGLGKDIPFVKRKWSKEDYLFQRQ